MDVRISTLVSAIVALSMLVYASSSSAQNLILDGSSFETGYDGFSALLAYSWTKHGLAGQDLRRGIIDATTAAHGKCSLRLQFHPPYGREGFSPWCTFRWIKIEEGQRYTVSLFAKKSRDGQNLTVSVSDNWQNGGTACPTSAARHATWCGRTLSSWAAASARCSGFTSCIPSKAPMRGGSSGPREWTASSTTVHRGLRWWPTAS